MRNFIFIIFCIICVNLSFAQETNKFRGGLETGCLYPYNGGFGFFPLSLELKYNIRDNMNVGLRPEFASFFKSKSYSAKVLSFLATYDYYFHYKNKLFSPFIGAGLGYYFCQANDHSAIEEEKTFSKYNNPTGFIRVGFEVWKFRASLSYNVIRKPNELNHSNRNNDYIALYIGFYVGGGKWKK